MELCNPPAPADGFTDEIDSSPEVSRPYSLQTAERERKDTMTRRASDQSSTVSTDGKRHAMDSQNPHKRKRSAIACTRCHNRKVRCSAAFQGIPCANCAQDGTHCVIYQPHSVRQDPLIATGDDRNKPVSPAYPLTPTPSLVPPTEVARRPESIATSRTKATEAGLSTHVASPDKSGPAVSTDDILQRSQLHSAPRVERVSRESLVPYYAGEVGGHEFLFDVCSPSRGLRGSPYIISRNIQKRQQFNINVGARPPFPSTVCRQLLRCFLHYVYPFMPVVNAGEFLTKYTTNPESISPLLLWSAFFAAASYIDADALGVTGFKTRKQLKEYCYQHAKAIYDAQQETDKTTIIGSTLLLAYWYIDLEDWDGSGYWIAIAIHLCHSIGLHREPNYGRFSKCPFPVSQRALWRRLWWCTYHRDAWFNLGSGRPMRIHIDDCDLQLPTLQDITIDFDDIPLDLRAEYIPERVEELAELWIRLLQLSIKLEYIVIMHYKPRRPPLSIAQLEADHAGILQLLNGLEQEDELGPKTFLLHMRHLKCFVHTIVIVLYRSYVLSTPSHLHAVEQENLQKNAIQSCKSSAVDITGTLNKLITQGLIETSPATLVTPIMAAMQIHFYELAKSEGLLREHAQHNLNLHFMVLTHMKKTFWTADMHHNLFTECIKALNSGKHEEKQYGGYGAGLEDPALSARSNTPHAAAREFQESNVNNVLEQTGLAEPAFDDLFAPFTLFDNFSALFEDKLGYHNTNDNNLA